MPPIRSQIDSNSDEFRQNYQHNHGLVETLAVRQVKARAGGSDRAVKRHHEAGKLLPRERVELLLD